MRRTGTMLLVLVVVAGCGSAVPPPSVTPRPQVQQKAATFSCDKKRVTLGALPADLTRAGAFTKVKAIRAKVEVHGQQWRRGDERLLAAAVCGVRSAERFATLVAHATLSQQQGRPALTWRSGGGLRNYLWLARPGTAVYLAATPGLAKQLGKLVATTTIH